MRIATTLLVAFLPHGALAQGPVYNDFYNCQRAKAIEAAALPDDAEVLGRVVTNMCPIEAQRVDDDMRRLLPGERVAATKAEFMAAQARVNSAAIVTERIARLKRQNMK